MKKENIKVITALGTGALIGGVLGILFAPAKGSETREKIKETFTDLKVKLQGLDKKDIKKYIEKKLDELDIEITKLDAETEFKKAKKQAKKVIKKINKLISYTKKKGMEEFEDLIEDLKDRAEEITEEILEEFDEFYDDKPIEF